MPVSKELLEILACPKCKGELKERNKKLICNSCRLKFNIEDNIPNMLIEEAEKF